MTDFTKDEALAFIDAIRLALEGKTGFKWFTERLSHLNSFVDSTTTENERLHAYLEWADAADDYEAYVVTHHKGGADGLGE